MRTIGCDVGQSRVGDDVEGAPLPELRAVDGARLL